MEAPASSGPPVGGSTGKSAKQARLEGRSIWQYAIVFKKVKTKFSRKIANDMNFGIVLTEFCPILTISLKINFESQIRFLPQ